MSEFNPGQILAVDWSHEGCCCDSHSGDPDVVFIRDYKDDWAEIAYSMGIYGVCVGYVPYSALSEV